MSSVPLSALTLVRATKEQEIEAANRCYLEWGQPKGLTLEQHLGFEEDLTGLVAGIDDKLITWVLSKRDEPRSLAFLCACKTYRRAGIVARAAAPGESESVLENITAYGIGAVFTPPENRGRGYASHMMRLLYWVLADRLGPQVVFPTKLWGEPPEIPACVGDGRFSVLYSDVGSKLYARCGPLPGAVGASDGWVVRGAVSTVWRVDQAAELLSGRLTEEADASEQPRWNLLDELSLKRLRPLDAKATALEMASTPSSKVKIAFAPEGGTASFMIERYKMDWQRLSPIPSIWGICRVRGDVGSPDELDVSAFATWSLVLRGLPHDYSLVITRLRCPLQLFEAIFKEILDQAKVNGAKKIEVWNLPEELCGLAHEFGGRTFEREEKLPALKWYRSQDISEVDWVLNER